MALISGVGTLLGIGKEVTPGTAVSRTRWVNLNGTTLTQTARKRQPRGALAKSKGFVEARFVTDNEVGGTLTTPVNYSGFGLLLEATLGTVSGTGPYTFAATNPSALPALTLEQVVGNSGKSEVYAGCKVNSLTLTVSPGGEVTYAFDVIGMTKATANTSGSPAVGTPVPMEAYECEVTYDGTTLDLLRDLTLVVSNNLVRRQRIGSLNTAEPQNDSPRVVTVTGTVDKEGFANRTAELTDAAADLVITLTDTATGAKSIEITISCQIKTDEQIGTTYGVLGDALTFESIGTPEIVITNGEATYDV